MSNSENPNCVRVPFGCTPAPVPSYPVGMSLPASSRKIVFIFIFACAATWYEVVAVGAMPSVGATTIGPPWSTVSARGAVTPPPDALLTDM